MTSGLFLSESELQDLTVQFVKFKLIYKDSYNEYLIRDKIVEIGLEKLCSIAIHLAIIGYGNKTVGSILFEDKEIDIKDFFTRNKIYWDLNLNTKLKPDDLTPRRIIRFFRYSIRDYLQKNTDVSSYLYKKYCLNKTEENRKIIFPGYEHIIDPNLNNNNVVELFNTYKFLDNRQNTKILERIRRVLIARGFNIENIERISELA